MPQLLLLALTVYLCLLGPGHAWTPRAVGGQDRLLIAVAISTLWTTIVSIALAACESWRLEYVLAAGLAVTSAGLLWRKIASRQSVTKSEKTGPRTALVAVLTPDGRKRLLPVAAGPLLAVLALAFYWPPYETHYAATDSTGYVTAGIHLSRSGALERDDPVGAAFPELLRRAVFLPALGKPGKAPFHRHPGAMNLLSIDSQRASPNFFPAPMIWSALCVELLGERYAGGYATVFAALSLWALYAFARRRVGALGAAGVAITMGLGLSGYWSARFALSEPITCFMLWTALVALDEAGRSQPASEVEARLPAAAAGFLLGATGLMRLDYSFFLASALAVHHLIGSLAKTRPAPGVFYQPLYAGFAAATLLVAVEVALLPGGYALPITDALGGIGHRVEMLVRLGPVVVAACLATAVAAVAVLARALGIVRAVLAGGVAAYVSAYLLASTAGVARSVSWLDAVLGWPLMLAGCCGLIALWRSRREHPANEFLVILLVLTGALLIYDPHVQPFLMWAMRRFTPLIIPGLIVAAAAAVGLLVKRAPIPGLAAGILLALSVVVPAQGLWRVPLYDGAYDGLAAFDAALPEDAALLIDAPLVSYILGSGLWLIHDRECIPVDTTTRAGRDAIPALVKRLGNKHRVLLVQDARMGVPALPFVNSRSTQTHVFEILFPQEPGSRSWVGARVYRPEIAVTELVPVRVPRAAATR